MECKDCGCWFTDTPGKPGYRWQCGECGAAAEREPRVVAGQAEDETGLGWQVVRNGDGSIPARNYIKLFTGLRRMQVA